MKTIEKYYTVEIWAGFSKRRWMQIGNWKPTLRKAVYIWRRANDPHNRLRIVEHTSRVVK